MRVLVVGGGGREHAIIRALLAEPGAGAPEVLCAPGNAGIAADARCLEIGAEEISDLVAAARDETVDLVIVPREPSSTETFAIVWVSGASTTVMKSYWPSVAHCSLTLTPSCSTSLFTS